MQRALDDASDARDLAKDVLRGLPDYNADDEESTARHEMPTPPAPPSIHVHLDSIHEEEPAKKQIRAGLVALGTGVGLALVTASVALLQRCGH